MSSNQKTVIVTGASSGIGFAIAEAYLARGYNVVGNARSAERLQAAAAQLGNPANFVGVPGDIADPQTAKALFSRAIESFGQVDILINNAGVTGGNGTTWELAPEVWRRVIEVNLVAPYLTCRALVPHMIERGYGRIVNIASVAGKEGNPNASHYSASKAGLIALTKSLAKELATKGVIVNAVTPAAAKTAIFETMTQAHIDFMLAKIPMGRFLAVDEAAAMIAWLSSEECSFSTGAVFDLTGGRSTY